MSHKVMAAPRLRLRSTGWLAAVVVAALGLSPAVVADPTATDDPNVAAVQSAGLYAIPTTSDRTGRVLAPVEINGRGPFRLILDTGANRSALSAQVAESLSLPATRAARLGVHGVTGAAEVPAVSVDSIKAGGILLERLDVPVLTGRVLAEADGILGIDGLQDARIDVDFVRDRVTIDRATGKRPRDGAMVIRAELRHGGLLVAHGKVGRVPVTVLIDTGAERSLGNMALHDALLIGGQRSSETVRTVVTGATPEIATGTSLRAPTVVIGDVRFRNLIVTFGDLHVFEVWGLVDEPAIVIGMDLLGTLQRFVVDYPRREFLLMSRTTGLKGVRQCGGTECRTRLPEN